MTAEARRPSSRRLILCSWALLLGLGGAVRADDTYQVRAFIQPDQEITETQRIRLVLQVEGSASPTLQTPRIDGLGNLRLLAGPDRRVNSVWTNGRLSSTLQLVYTLLPEAAGSAEVPAIDVVVDGRTYRTDPIRFEVAAAAAGAPPPRTSERTRRSEQRADVFLRSQVGSPEAWVGQSVPMSVTLYAAERVSNPNWVAQPALASFWVEDLEVDSDSEAYETTEDGRRYVAYPMRRLVLVPQAPGEVEIEPWALQLQVRQRSSGDPFDFFSLGRGQTIVRKSGPVKLRIKPLPDRGRPEVFSGAVGSYSLRVALDRTETAVNDAVALKATVEGEGTLRGVAPPAFEPPSDLKLFDPKVTSSFRTVRGKMVSKKTWEWILVPLAPGEMKLPPVSFNFFDPQSGSYQVETSEPQRLIVQRGGEPDGAGPAHGDIQLQRRDLAFIKPLRGRLSEGSARAHRSGLYLTLLCLPLAWVPLVVVLGRHRARLQQNRGLARSRRARSRARKRLRAARKHLDGAGAAGFHEEVARALVDYVADRFDRSSAGLTYDMADELLVSKGVDIDLRRRFRSCLETCDFARFVPASNDSERKTEIIDEATALMDQLEKAW